MEPPDEQDKRLMLQLASGDDLALNALMRRWEVPLRGFIARFIQDQDEAEDLAQETFARIYRARQRYQPTAKFSTWMFSIALNLARTHLKRRNRRPFSFFGLGNSHGDDPPDGLERSVSPDPAPDDVLLVDEAAAAVREAIGELAPDLRSAVLLFEYEDLSHAEIAKIEGCSPKAVETRLYRARQLLKKRLARYLDATPSNRG
jgi:RNA polymerase sigma-70 factor, ECF subfamily